MIINFRMTGSRPTDQATELAKDRIVAYAAGSGSCACNPPSSRLVNHANFSSIGHTNLCSICSASLHKWTPNTKYLTSSSCHNSCHPLLHFPHSFWVNPLLLPLLVLLHSRYYTLLSRIKSMCPSKLSFIAVRSENFWGLWQVRVLFTATHLFH